MATQGLGFRALNQLHIGQAFRLVWQGTCVWTLLNAILMIIQGMLPLLTLYLMKLIIDAVTSGITAEADLGYYEDSKHYDTLHRAQQEGSYRLGKIVYGLMQFGQSGVTLLAIAGLLLAFHWLNFYLSW